jgi:hypothetical protein
MIILYILAPSLFWVSPISFAEIMSLSQLQVVRDMYKHLQTLSGISPIYLNFSDFSYSDLENFTKSLVDSQTNAT